MIIVGSTARSMRWFIAQQSSSNSGWYNMGWSGVINDYSVVHISAGEARLVIDLHGTNPGKDLYAIHHYKGNNPPFAKVFVKNVCPHSDAGGGVNFWLEIESSKPIDIVVDITVFDAPDPEHFVITR